MPRVIQVPPRDVSFGAWTTLADASLSAADLAARLAHVLRSVRHDLANESEPRNPRAALAKAEALREAVRAFRGLPAIALHGPVERLTSAAEAAVAAMQPLAGQPEHPEAAAALETLRQRIGAELVALAALAASQRRA